MSSSSVRRFVFRRMWISSSGSPETSTRATPRARRAVSSRRASRRSSARLRPDRARRKTSLRRATTCTFGLSASAGSRRAACASCRRVSFVALWRSVFSGNRRVITPPPSLAVEEISSKSGILRSSFSNGVSSASPTSSAAAPRHVAEMRIVCVSKAGKNRVSILPATSSPEASITSISKFGARRCPAKAWINPIAFYFSGEGGGENALFLKQQVIPVPRFL